MGPVAWLESLLVSDEPVVMILGLTVVAMVAYLAHYLGTVLAETIIAVIERDR